jgi:hypothetical protein
MLAGVRLGFGAWDGRIRCPGRSGLWKLERGGKMGCLSLDRAQITTEVLYIPSMIQLMLLLVMGHEEKGRNEGKYFEFETP